MHLALCTFLIALCTLCNAHADQSDPTTYRVYGTWNGAITMLSDPPGYALHRSQPAWMSSTPSISILKSSGVVEYSGMALEDIRVVTAWKKRLFIVRSDSKGCRIDLLDRQLKVLRSWFVFLGGQLGAGITTEVLCSDNSNIVFVRLGSTLWALNVLEDTGVCSLVEEHVRGAALTENFSGSVAVMHDVGSIAYLSVIDSQMRRRVATAVPLAPEARIEPAEDVLLIISPIDAERGTQITLVNTELSNTRTMSVQSNADLVDAFSLNNAVCIALLSQRSGRFELIADKAEQISSESKQGTILPGEFGKPLALRVLDRSIVIVFSGGIVTTDLKGNITSRDAIRFDVDPSSLAVGQNETGLLVVSNRGSILLASAINPFWWLVRFLETAGRFVIPALLAIVIGLLILRLRRQKRVLNAMLEMPGAGLVFVVDSAGRLLRTNERGRKLLGITKNIPMRRVYHAYTRHKGVAVLQAFLTQTLAVRKPVSEKVAIDDGDELREYVFTAIPLFGTLGRMRSIVVTGVDITEALERKRLVNWAQLAHDMQTNLSTIRLNAEQLEAAEEGINKERLRRILFQTSVLIQRVRDLVSVGRSEDLNRMPVHSAEFCTQIRHEFDPAMFPHVSFSMKLRGTMMNIDRLKMSRAVRNAVENAIKSLRGNPGTVEIATWFDRSNVYIRISDTGVGMDTITLANMMKPYFTTAKDGTGTGIGTMIMQHVTHLHGGTLRVTSEPGAGTQVIFRIPHHMDGLRNEVGVTYAEVEA